MEVLNNFKDLFLSVWDSGIMGVDFVQIIIGLIIFFVFLVFRGLISKLIIKKLELISKRTTNKLDDTFVKAMQGPARFLPIVLGVFFASYYMSFSDPIVRNLKFQAKFQKKGRVLTELLNQEIFLTLFEEKITSSELGWTIINRYWIDDKSFIWKSEQSISPKVPKIFIEVTKKPSK